MLELKGVTKQYLYGARVLSAIDTVIRNGEIVAVLGGDGSGKTTFIKTVSGVTESDGTVLLDSKPIRVKTDDVIVMFDDGALFSRKTVYKNLAYPLKIRKIETAEIDSRVKAAAELTGIYPVLYSPVFKLSAVDKKRVSAARLFLRGAKVLMLDQPTAHLEREDAENWWRELALLLIKEKEKGKTVIFTTANADEAVSISDRIIVLHAGEVKQIGTADEISKTPQSVWAAEALDKNYNVEKVLLCEADGKLTLEFEGKYVLSAEAFRGKIVDGYVGKNVLAGWHGNAFLNENGIECAFPEVKTPVSDTEDNKNEVDGATDRANLRKEKVVYSLKEIGGYVMYTESGKKLLSDKLFNQVVTLPDVDNVCLFDAENENSIML